MGEAAAEVVEQLVPRVGSDRLAASSLTSGPSGGARRAVTAAHRAGMMMGGMDQWVFDALATARVARLGTVGADGAVRLVPICFAVVDGFVASAVDHKPKRTGQLRRFRDMAESGTATVLVDHYEEDWSMLWWVRVRGRATVHPTDDSDAVSAVDALVAKYEQYRDVRPTGEVFRLALDEVRWWSAAS